MMLNEILRFHHMGLGLRSEKRAIFFLKDTGYEIGDKIYDPLQLVNLRMCRHDSQPDIELVLPGESDGPLTPLLKHFDELIYHICYEIDDLDEVLDRLDEIGLRALPVTAPKPAILFGGRMVSFYKVQGFGLIELLER